MEPTFDGAFGDILGEIFGKKPTEEHADIHSLLRLRPELVTRRQAQRILGYQLLRLAAGARHLCDIAKKA